MDAEALDILLAEVSADTLARWYVSLNCWHWPRDCPVPRPPDFVDEATVVSTHATGKLLWDYVHTHTTPEARSRAWWLLALERTEADWRAFWTLPVCASCGYRHLTTRHCASVSPWQHALRVPVHLLRRLRHALTGACSCC